MTCTMRFSWRALALAPLVIPVVYSAAFDPLIAGRNLMFGFLLFLAIGAVFTYGATFVLLLPCLYALSWHVRLNAAWCAGVGAVLGLLVYLPEEWVSWHASGVDSGPPSDTFAHYLARNFWSFELPAFLFAGLATALLYWWLATPRSPRRPMPTA